MYCTHILFLFFNLKQTLIKYSRQTHEYFFPGLHNFPSFESCYHAVITAVRMIMTQVYRVIQLNYNYDNSNQFIENLKRLYCFQGIKIV